MDKHEKEPVALNVVEGLSVDILEVCVNHVRFFARARLRQMCNRSVRGGKSKGEKKRKS